VTRPADLRRGDEIIVPSTHELAGQTVCVNDVSVAVDDDDRWTLWTKGERPSTIAIVCAADDEIERLP
jgi:hypothetical protein